MKNKYIEGKKNIVADALSRLDFTPYESNSNDNIGILFGLLRIEDAELFLVRMLETS